MLLMDSITCIKCGETLGDYEDRVNGLNQLCFNHEDYCTTCYRKSLTFKPHRRFLFHALNYLARPDKEQTVFNAMPSVTHYRGRFFYNGPAITAPWSLINELETQMKRNKVPYQIDNMGLDGIIYGR